MPSSSLYHFLYYLVSSLLVPVNFVRIQTNGSEHAYRQGVRHVVHRAERIWTANNAVRPHLSPLHHGAPYIREQMRGGWRSFAADQFMSTIRPALYNC